MSRHSSQEEDELDGILRFKTRTAASRAQLCINKIKMRVFSRRTSRDGR